MDCEMVGVGYEGNDHMIARVSIVNKFGDCIYDKFVKAREEVVDYRTKVSGIRKEDLLNGEEFATVQKEVSELIKGKILVGHSLKNDLSVLFLSHPKRNIRDTSRYKPFRKITKGSTPSLKRLAKEILGIDIQDGEHSSVEDARAAMQIYCTVQKSWEQALSEKRGYSRKFVET
ncbi:RNA exonuclease 4 [Danaus plexippus plexippus]|uniref:RNA exonuclease 4 n=2 Tax=Danaus plexippus TaxID=13037 RepID=A0A212F0M5_DANPL|nr:RNA exonuclease 4 [Danaus plexippus plexippus]